MSEVDYYPPGAYNDPNAPWNQSEPDEREFEVCISQSLSKSTSVSTKDYIPMIDESEDGSFPYADTSETNWKEAYNEEHYTPLELIEVLKSICEEIMNHGGIVTNYKYESLIRECSNWIEDETELIEE